MTTELSVLVLAALLQVVQIALYAVAGNLQLLRESPARPLVDEAEVRGLVGGIERGGAVGDEAGPVPAQDVAEEHLGVVRRHRRAQRLGQRDLLTDGQFVGKERGEAGSNPGGHRKPHHPPWSARS